MNKADTRNNMVKEWLRYNYSTQSLQWHLDRAFTEKFEDFPLWARSWKGESDFE